MTFPPKQPPAARAAGRPLGEVEGVQLRTEREGSSLIVHLQGELDMASAGAFAAAVDRELEHARRLRTLVLDLGGVPFVDSSGVGAILGRYKRLTERGGRVVARGVRGTVRRVLELSGVLRVVELEEDPPQGS